MRNFIDRFAWPLRVNEPGDHTDGKTAPECCHQAGGRVVSQVTRDIADMSRERDGRRWRINRDGDDFRGWRRTVVAFTRREPLLCTHLAGDCFAVLVWRDF